MKKFFLLMFILGQMNFAQNATPPSNNNNTYDTVSVSIVKYTKSNWMERNEGSLISAAVGILIAFVSVYFSYHSSKRIEKEKLKKAEKKIRELYKGYLFAIKTEIINHEKLVPFIKEEFEGIISKSIEKKRIIIERPARIIPITYLTMLRLKLLESEIYNSQIFVILTAYVSKCELINNDLDLTTEITLIEKLSDEINFEEALNDLKQKMSEQIDSIIQGGNALIQYIDDDLKRIGVNVAKSNKDFQIRAN